MLNTYMLDDPPEVVLALSACKSSDGVAGKVASDHVLKTLLAHSTRRDIESSLDDGEQVLLRGAAVLLNTAILHT